MTKRVPRILGLFFAAALLAALCSACAPREKQGQMEFALDKTTDTYALAYYADTSTAVELVIPDTFKGKPVTKIGRLAVNSADTLERIVIGPNVTEIEPWAITKNIHLKEIAVHPDNPSFRDIDGVLFTKDQTKLLVYPNANEAVYAKDGRLESTVEYTAPDGTEIIGHCAFYHCYAVGKLTLPGTVTEIEERAFHKMTGLTEIDVGAGLVKLGADAFLGCEALKEIDLPDTLREIGDYAFYNAMAIEVIRIAAPEASVTQGEKWRPLAAGSKLGHPWRIEWADKTETY